MITEADLRHQRDHGSNVAVSGPLGEEAEDLVAVWDPLVPRTRLVGPQRGAHGIGAIGKTAGRGEFVDPSNKGVRGPEFQCPHVRPPARAVAL
jgi:hypothetical protein